MINIISKQLEFEKELKRKIEFICDFCNTKPKIIKGITFLAFNYSKILYINNLSNSIEIKDLIYLIRKKLKKQLNILIKKWKNQQKIFILIKKIKKKTMAYHYKLSSALYKYSSGIVGYPLI